jgi:hypothetical protein
LHVVVADALSLHTSPAHKGKALIHTCDAYRNAGGHGLEQAALSGSLLVEHAHLLVLQHLAHLYKVGADVLRLHARSDASTIGI